MREWIRENPWMAVILFLLIGALFFAGPIALVIVKAKSFFAGHSSAPGGAAANPQETVSQKATH